MSVYGSYEVTFGNPNSTWARAGAMVRPGSTVLDVGCAAGQLAKALTEHLGCVVDGIELDSGDAAKAEAYCRRVLVGDLIDVIGRVDSPYDHVVMLDVLEHMPDPARALEVVAEALAPDGSAILSVPNMAHASVRLQLLQGHFPAEAEGLLDRTHLHFFDVVTVRSLIAASPLRLASLDRIVLDVLPDAINDSLRAVGLEPTPAFAAFIASREASTYQFVARLVHGRSTDDDVEREEYVAPLTQYWKQVRALQARVSDLEADLARHQRTSVRVPAPLVRMGRSLARRFRP